MEVITDVVQSVAYQSAAPQGLSAMGMYVMGSYRKNELNQTVKGQIQVLEQMPGSVNVTHISVCELPILAINEMISFKLGLPVRSTKQLSELIFSKTRGLPLFVVKFIQQIVSKDVLNFSVKSRQWMWDDMVLDFFDISEDVAEFIADGLQSLKPDIIDTLKVVSALGFQVDDAVIELLDSCQFVPGMKISLEMAMKEGILEKAGPIWAWSHDMLKEATYNLIPEADRKSLHKQIGVCLAASSEDVASKAAVCILSVDQINICQGTLNQLEKVLFARLNLAAGKHSMASSSYDQARSYYEAGIALLHQDHWSRQYSLSLELHEQSVYVSFMDGNIENAQNRLDSIQRHAKSFEHTLNARSLYLKILGSSGDYATATSECLQILARLGEKFPEKIELSVVINEIVRTEALLKDVTKEQILSLQKMTDTSKLQSMAFLSMLCKFSMHSEPLLCHMASCIMMKLTFCYGFVEESILGLATFPRGM